MKGLTAIGVALLATLATAQTWTGAAGRTAPFADWHEGANWSGGTAPEGRGARADIEPQGAGQYIQIRREVTLGELHITGSDSPPGGLLAEEDGAILFDNGNTPAVLDYTREARNIIDIPIGFARDLVVTLGPEKRTPRVLSSYFFGTKADFTSRARDGRAALTFDVRSMVQPWIQERILEQLKQNTVRGYIEDGDNGAVLRVVKDGPGTLAFTSGDNGYSGGTEIRMGTLCAVNAPNLEPPFMGLGAGSEVRLMSEKAEVALVSSRPGTWGPGDGYTLEAPHGGTISFRNTEPWTGRIPQTAMATVEHRVGALSLGDGTTILRERTPGRLVAAGETMLTGGTATIRVQSLAGTPLHAATAELRGGIRERSPEGKPCGLRKTGKGLLRIAGEGRFSGGMDIAEGAVAAGTGDELGTGPVTVRDKAALAMEKPGFQTRGELRQEAGSAEVWLDERARFGADWTERETWRMAEGVDLYVEGDLMDVENKTLVMTGGRLGAWRPTTTQDAQTHVLGNGVDIRTTDDFTVGTVPPAWVARDHRAWWLRGRAEHPLDIRGKIEEERAGCALVKVGNDEVVLRGPCRLTGGTRVESGTLTVDEGGRLPEGGVKTAWTGDFSGGKPMGKAWLKLKAPETLPEGSTVELGAGGVLELDFDGEIVVPKMRIGELELAPGAYRAEDDECGGQVAGRGWLVVSGW